jgi:hypothetical protein
VNSMLTCHFVDIDSMLLGLHAIAGASLTRRVAQQYLSSIPIPLIAEIY